MSRLYEMEISVKGFDFAKSDGIVKVISSEFPVENSGMDSIDGSTLWAYGQGYLCGGETEEEFADRIAKAIWQANSGYCSVQIEATCLEDLPRRTHIMQKYFILYSKREDTAKKLEAENDVCIVARFFAAVYFACAITHQFQLILKIGR